MEHTLITVEYPSQIKRLIGLAGEELAVVAGATVRDALTELVRRHPAALGPLFGALLGPPVGARFGPVLVFLNDEQITDEADAALRSGDRITITLPISGGSDLPPPTPARRLALTSEERAIYEWQIWVEGLGEEGQERLKGATVLVTRVGGLGGVVAYELAAAGVGRLVLAHAGNVKPSDLNRQLLMTHEGIGSPRVETAAIRLRELNPRLEVVPIAENASPGNARRLVESADVVVDCAPLFEERFALNAEAIRQRKPLVECAMFELEVQLTTVLPGRTPCVACLYPEPPPTWRREFPVLGAVSGAVGCLGALEAIKVITGLAPPLQGELLVADLGTMRFRKLAIRRRPDCEVCGHLPGPREA